MLFYKSDIQTPVSLRSVWMAIPSAAPDPLMKYSAITVFRDSDTEESAMEFLKSSGLEKLIDEFGITVAFPDPVDGTWQLGDGKEPSDDEMFASAFASMGIGMLARGWRANLDCHYIVGIGCGATLVNQLAAVRPAVGTTAAICTVGGTMPKAALDNASGSAVPAYILGGDKAAIEYFASVNKAEDDGSGNYTCPWNKLQRVWTEPDAVMTPERGAKMWEEFFMLIRRVNTSPTGDVDSRVVYHKLRHELHRKDTCLGDNGGLDHDWIECVPQSVLDNPEKKVPLLLFSHGMGDNLFNTTDMAKFHEVGEREGFITVYPSSCNRRGWNLACDPEQYSDVEYYEALIKYLVAKYPIDTTRIYTSGFSNGAGMAMLFAMTRPDLIAASCPVDSTFPYVSMGHFRPAHAAPYLSLPGQQPPRQIMPVNDAEKNHAPLLAALERQKEKAYKMPVMYFYGTRESEYPIRSGCNQELSYNFWKEFNGIAIEPTTDCLEPDAVGVAGQEINELFPCPELPHHRYTEHVFFTEDGHEDYYHFLLMHGKAHEVHPVERELGWKFVSRFSRLPDGTLIDSAKK